MKRRIHTGKSAIALFFIIAISFTAFTLHTTNAEAEEQVQIIAPEAIEQVPAEYHDMILAAADEFDVPMQWIAGFIAVESEGNPRARSSTGVKGIMQTTRKTIADVRRLYPDKEFGDNRYDVQNSIRIGTAYIAALRDFYGLKTRDEIAVAYNIGPNALKKLSNMEVEDHFYPERMRKVLAINK